MKKKIKIEYAIHCKKNDMMIMIFPTFGYLSEKDEFSFNFVWLFFDIALCFKNK